MLESNSDKVRGWARVSPQSAWRPNEWMSVGTCWISYLRPLIDLFHDRQRFIYASTIRANDTKMSGLYMYRKIVRKGNNNNQRHKVKGNFVLQAAPGCHIIHDNKPPNWIVGIDTFAPEDFGLTIDNEDQMPDISIDPESGLLTCINKHNNNIRTFYISVSCNLYNVDMEAMDKGEARDTKGNLFECSTFVIVLEPRKLIDVSLMNKLGWRYRIDLREGLSDTYKWYQENLKGHAF